MREELRRVLAGIDVLVAPSRWYENAPGVIFEAFAAGTPAVATDLGGMSEFVRHGQIGLLFGVEDAQDPASQLQRLAEEPDLLPELLVEIGAVKSAGEYADEMEEIYDTLLDRRTRY